MKDKEAFEKWCKVNNYLRHDLLEAWQAACDYKQREIDKLQAENTALKANINGTRMKQMNEEIETLKAENAKLKAALVEISLETRFIEGVECSTNAATIAAEALEEK